MTKIIGVNEAKAIRPNPSIIGLRPLMLVARPTPRAVTSGTVTVEVVEAESNLEAGSSPCPRRVQPETQVPPAAPLHRAGISSRGFDHCDGPVVATDEGQRRGCEVD